MIKEGDQMKIIHVCEDSSKYFEFASFYNSQWTHHAVASKADFYDRNGLYVSLIAWCLITTPGPPFTNML